MKKMLTALVVAITVGFGGFAFADNSSGFDARAAAKSDCAKAKAKGKACKITFDQGDTIEGNGIGSGNDTVIVPVDLPFSSLIKLRMDFHDLLIKSAENV